MTGAGARLARRLTLAYGLLRSLRMYWGSSRRLRRMRRFYAAFVRPGDLCFDVGAHAGNRTWTFARLGARVVALEPQPAFARLLRWLGRGLGGRVEVLPLAVGAAPGRLELVLSTATPTVASASRGFLEAVATVPSFAWVRWDERLAVEVTTLDALVAAHGTPRFVKIDVEGMEAEVLEGLSAPVPALSFEFVPAYPRAALRCLARLEALGPYRYNVVLGESFEFELPGWTTADAVARWLEARPRDGDSGDVYARLEGTAERTTEGIAA